MTKWPGWAAFATSGAWTSQRKVTSENCSRLTIWYMLSPVTFKTAGLYRLKPSAGMAQTSCRISSSAMKRTMSSLVLLSFFLSSPAPAQDGTWNLAIGDAARKEKSVRPLLDTVIDLRSGDSLTPAGLAERLKGVRLLFVGESHTDIEIHRMQLRVFQELKRLGRRVHVGLEMYPY